MICKAKLTAQNRTNKSPILILNGRFKERKLKPSAAKNAPIIAYAEGTCFSKTTENNGTNTTDNPVIKPALEAVVYCRPIV